MINFKQFFAGNKQWLQKVANLLFWIEFGIWGDINNSEVFFVWEYDKFSLNDYGKWRVHCSMSTDSKRIEALCISMKRYTYLCWYQDMISRFTRSDHNFVLENFEEKGRKFRVFNVLRSLFHCETNLHELKREGIVGNLLLANTIST